LSNLSRSALQFVVVASLLAATAPAQARAKRPRAPEPKAAETEPAPPPRFHPRVGPAKLDLGHDLQLDLPAGMAFFDPKDGKTLLEENGSVVGDAFQGLVVQQDKSWMVLISYQDEGYVKDDDAAHFDEAEILSNIKEGTEEDNKTRVERGFKALVIDGWSEPPRYEKANHHLVWGVSVHDADGASVNFFTRMLGRRGYVALNLIDDPSKIAQSKGEALVLLSATSFTPGSRYQDFDGKKDKVAEYGLAALVAGGAGAAALKLAKIGLLAKFGGKILALLLAFKKGLILLLAGGAAFLRRAWSALRGRSKEPTVAPAADEPPAP
jgi:uncharacterized membrane-anchored protein